MALATRDSALYAELAGVVRERRIRSISILPEQRVPDQVAIVLTTAGEAGSVAHPHVLPVPPDGDRTAVWAEVESALAAGDAHVELVIGIDPGPRPGFAIFEGPVCLGEGTLASPEEVGHLGIQMHRRFPGRAIRFRVGNGDRLDRDRILNELLASRRTVEVVDERGTTPRGHRRPRDAVAARAIAGTGGWAVRSRAPLRVTPGEITNLQRVSREDSGGQFTLPRRVAEGVLRGELSLVEALAEAERRYTAASRHHGSRGSEPS